MKTGREKPLYRRVNTRTHGVVHGHGGKSKWARNTKENQNDQSTHGSMHSTHRHGYDYTPLFRFLISRVGKDWDKTYREAISRLDKEEPIFWMVARSKIDEEPFVRLGESTYFSGLFVDEDNVLSLVAPDLSVDDMVPSCSCCTHTFNGSRFTKAYPALEV